MVESDQRFGGPGAVVEQGGGQPVSAAVGGAVVAGDRHRCFDDPDLQRADQREERPVGQLVQHRRAAGGGQPDQELGPGGGEFGHKVPGVEPAVQQYQHRGIQQVQQLARPVQLASGGGPEYRAEQRAGAGLHQRHQLDHWVAGLPIHRVHLAQPGPVPRCVRDLDRLAPVEGHGAEPAKAHARNARPRGRPGQHLKQRLQRRGAHPPPQVPQCLRRGHRQAQPVQRRSQLRPHAPVALPREQPQGQHEVDPNPRGQQPQPPLGSPGIGQHPVYQIERDHLRQLTQVPRREHPRRHRDRLRDGRDSNADGRLNAQRRSSPTGYLGGFRSNRTSVGSPAPPHRVPVAPPRVPPSVRRLRVTHTSTTTHALARPPFP